MLLQVCVFFVLFLTDFAKSVENSDKVAFVTKGELDKIWDEIYKIKSNNTDELEERIEILEGSMVVVEEDIDNLENEDALINVRLFEIETDVFENENAIEDLTDRADTTDALLLNHTTQISDNSAAINDLNARVDSLEAADVEIQIRLSNLEERVNAPWTSCESSPCDNGASCVDVNVDTFICTCRDGYFGITCSESYWDTAFLAAKFGGNTQVEDPILFDDERFDHGGNYNPSTGIYTVPIDGTYEFYVQIFGDLDPDVRMIFYMLVDGVFVTDTGHPNYADEIAPVSAVSKVLLELSAGQEVWVSPNNFVYTITGTYENGMGCWFSGRLIMPN